MTIRCKCCMTWRCLIRISARRNVKAFWMPLWIICGMSMDSTLTTYSTGTDTANGTRMPRGTGARVDVSLFDGLSPADTNKFVTGDGQDGSARHARQSLIPPAERRFIFWDGEG